MSQNITAKVQATVSVSETLSDGLGTGTIADTISFVSALNNGTGTGNVNEHFPINVTTTISTPITYTLSALTDGLGRSVAFTKIRLLIIVNLSTTDGQNLTVGNAATHPWTAALGGTTPTVLVPAGGMLIIAAPLATALAVTASTSDQLKIDPGAAAIPFQMLIAGE